MREKCEIRHLRVKLVRVSIEFSANLPAEVFAERYDHRLAGEA
jgi:hypothetical protein